MRSSGSPLVGLLLAFFCPFAAAEFLPGHVYVSTTFSGGPQKGIARIYEVNPQTGVVSTFAEQGDHYNVSGLTFTPDGSRLLASEFWPASILAIDGAGSFSTILDQSDGLGGPFGSNNLTFGPDGALYVADGGSGYIRRFPGGAGPGEVFALSPGYGAIAFGASGDLFHAPGAGVIRRIKPDGTLETFDTFDGNVSVVSLTCDLGGNVYVLSSTGTLYRYANESADQQEIVTSGLGGAGTGSTIAMTPDQASIYFARSGATNWELLQIALDNGSVSTLTSFNFKPRGMAVFVPEPSTAGLFAIGVFVAALVKHRRRRN